MSNKKLLEVKTTEVFEKNREELANRAKAVVEDAIYRLKTAQAAISCDPQNFADDTRRMLERFFLIDSRSRNDKTPSHLRKMITTLEMVANGLNSEIGDVVLKVGEYVGRAGKTPLQGELVAGEVSMNGKRYWTAGKLRNAEKGKDLDRKDFKRDYYNNVVWQGEDGGGESVRVAHAIKIDIHRLRGAFATKTLVHEASHKYTGTVDYCLFSDEVNNPPKSIFQSVDSALKNADSYGWFAFHVGANGSKL
jgi:hypothetical protein